MKESRFQTVKNMADDEGFGGAGAWVKLLRAYMHKERQQESASHGVHDINRVRSYSEVLLCMVKWEAALTEHVRGRGP